MSKLQDKDAWHLWISLRLVLRIILFLFSALGFGFYICTAERIGQCEILIMSVWAWSISLSLK